MLGATCSRTDRRPGTPVAPETAPSQAAPPKPAAEHQPAAQQQPSAESTRKEVRPDSTPHSASRTIINGGR